MTAQRVDDDSLLVGNPSRLGSSGSSEDILDSEESPDGHSARCYDNLYFVLLTHECVKKTREYPIPDLRLGSALGAGDRQIYHAFHCKSPSRFASCLLADSRTTFW